MFQFEGDTSLVCFKVSSYNTKSLKYKDSILSERYTIQLSALFYINMICFAQYASFMYSPYPVLYDTLSGQEINDDVIKIKEVFNIYKIWFKEAKDKDFKNYSFPLFGTRYKWKHGDYSKRINLTELPVIESEYKYRIGRPVN